MKIRGFTPNLLTTAAKHETYMDLIRNCKIVMKKRRK